MPICHFAEAKEKKKLRKRPQTGGLTGPIGTALFFRSARLRSMVPSASCPLGARRENQMPALPHLQLEIHSVLGKLTDKPCCKHIVWNAPLCFVFRSLSATVDLAPGFQNFRMVAVFSAKKKSLFVAIAKTMEHQNQHTNTMVIGCHVSNLRAQASNGLSMCITIFPAECGIWVT